MSEFPQPTPAPIFNPTDYPQIFSNTGLDFPNAQGTENWFGTNSILSISGTNLTYNGTSVSWANLATKVQAIGAVTQATNSTTLNVDNSVRIQNGETINNPTSYVDITSGLTNEIVSTTNLLLEAPTIDISGQASFQLPPHMPQPILGNDGATKSYVDSLVGQYAGGYNLFFNYSQTDITYPTNKVLAKLVSGAGQQTNVITGFTSGTQIVATFISEPLNISEIPAGLWDALVYGAVSGTGGDVHYSYEVFKVDNLGNETSIAQSGISSDVNASPNNNPTAYSINATFSTAVVMIPTDRIRIVLSVTKTGTNTISLTTYFENQYYSFIQTSLNAGTTLLSSNNTWTGTNEFSLPATTPTQVGTPANTDIVNYETITTLIGDIPTPDLGDVLGVGTDANANNITNVNTLQSNYGVYVGSTSADYVAITPTIIDITNGVVAYPNTHLDKTYLSIDASSNQYARLGNIDTPRLSLNTPTRTTELTAQSFYAGVGFGNASQVLTRTANDFEYEWKDIPVVVEEPIVSTSNIFLSTINSAFQYPPAEPPSSIINTYQYYGWYFINSVALRKIDWYFPPSKNMLVSDILGLYINFFNITTTDPQNVPFISVYTKPTGTNDAIPFFAHSVMTYSLYDGLPINPFLPVANTAYCGFMNKSGTQPNPFAYGHTIQNMLISPVPNNPRGDYLPTEEVAYITVGSNSTSSVNQVNFVLSKVGICLANGNQENILNPQNILSPSSTWVNTATSNLNMSTFSIDASANNLLLGTLTSTGVTLGKAGNITNIKGHLQIAGQPGTSGQFLTSNGAGNVPTWTTSTSGWVGTATSQLNMGIYDISGAVLDNSGGILTIGANTTTTTIGKATTGITNLQGIVKINNSVGTSGQVLTSTGTSSAPTWQTPTGGSSNITYFQSFQSAGEGLLPTSAVIYLPITVTVPSITATYLFTSSTFCNTTTPTIVGSDIYITIAQQAGAVANPGTATNILGGALATTALNNLTAFTRTTLTSITAYSPLSFSYVFTPGIVGQRTFGILMYTSLGGTKRVQSLQIMQLTA